MKIEILRTLKEHKNKYVSGQEISNRLDVSRTAVWKNISALRDEGYEIKSSSKKGYKLLSIPEALSAGEIKVSLSNSFIGKEIYYKKQVESTNTIAKELAVKGCTEGSLILADQQTAGRGRRGRTWSSPPGKGIWMSIVLRPNLPPYQVSFITLLTALAVTRGIEKTVGIMPEIKWPNDIILNKKKVCGILTEMSAEMEAVDYIVVGIGINVNMNLNDFPLELHPKATSIKMVTGYSIQRNNLVKNILEQMEGLYLKFIKKCNYTQLINEYKKYSVTLGQKVKVIGQSQEIYATAIDVNDKGELIIQTDEGHIHSIISGEVSVRGLYGYI